jgi:hypothetical protein
VEKRRKTGVSRDVSVSTGAKVTSSALSESVNLPNAAAPRA